MPHPAAPGIVVDLGADLGSRRWWRGMAMLLLLLALAPTLALWPGPYRATDRHIPNETTDVLTPSPPQANPKGQNNPTTSDPTQTESVAAAPPTEGETGQSGDADGQTLITPQSLRRAHVLGSGDTLIALLLRAGAGNIEAHQAVATLRDIFNPRKLRAGQEIWTEIEPAEQPSQNTVLKSLEFDMGFAERLRVSRGKNGGFVAQRSSLEVSRSWVSADGLIDDSLYLAAERADVPAAAIVNLIRIFSFNVDFQRDIWPGDHFALTYEKLENTDGKVRLGEILFGELVLRGKAISLYRFTPADGRTDYFDKNGVSARRLLMRTPIDGARLSSRFGKRKHPILGYTKMHSGIDFAAPTGTPIMAAGDGVIEFIGRHGGYGNLIRLRHNGTYKTAYAHMSRFKSGMARGKRVRQGEIIGYVGSTGRSTGPHLHYEVFMHDQRVNPLSLRLPTGKELSGNDLEQFKARQAEIDTARKAPSPSLVAASQSD